LWIFEVELTDGTPLQAYKHVDTRGYVHLAPDGAAFVFEPRRSARTAIRTGASRRRDRQGGAHTQDLLDDRVV
jgi:hypothetical protein